MTSEITVTDVRQALSEQAEQLGWRRVQRERVDIYIRGDFHIHAMWRDGSTVNGGAQYEDSVLLNYTSDLAKIQVWLSK